MKRSGIALLLLCGLWPTAARADWLTLTAEANGTPRHFANFRIGGGMATVNHPELCMEVSPIPLLGLEACGTGGGFLHHDPAPEVAHFRASVRLASWQTGLGWLQPRLEGGFAELQVGQDDAGFTFGGVSANRNETSGAEAGASLRLLTPIGHGLELVTQTQAGAAYFPYARDLAKPLPTVQLGATATIGIGF